MLWIIMIVFYFLLRALFDSDVPQDNCSPPRRLQGEEEHVFREKLKSKTEKELWELRNEYHADLVKAHGREDYYYYLDCIGVIDERIYFLRHQ
uniref:Uncharacterized protein n=1 Tax=uncultured Alphaproteobacteria bacterium TaxID=91750 RepID=A0A6G8F363_9PROT|nr:hypothetical protein PlAlph_4030 [uncultured Alphaproteobacteria bacterium]